MTPWDTGAYDAYTVRPDSLGSVGICNLIEMNSNIYAIDYGAYVDLIGTSKEPELGFSPGREGGDIIVPFDDKRSIRRIVLDAAFLA